MSDQRTPDFEDRDLSERYRASARQQPPRALDREVLKLAREAGKEERKRDRALWRHWITPVATTATVRIVVGLVRFLPPEDIHRAPMEAQEQEKAARGNLQIGEPETMASEDESPSGSIAEERDQREMKQRKVGTETKSISTEEAMQEYAPSAKALSPPASEALSKDDLTKSLEGLDVQKLAPDRYRPDQDEPEPDRADDQVDVFETPEAWVKHIQELVEGGYSAAARMSIERFTDRYPRHPDLERLNALLEQQGE